MFYILERFSLKHLLILFKKIANVLLIFFIYILSVLVKLSVNNFSSSSKNLIKALGVCSANLFSLVWHDNQYITKVWNGTSCSRKKSESSGKEAEWNGDEHATRSRRWFSGDMFRPCQAFNFAQKLKWYRPVSRRERSLRRVEIEGRNLATPAGRRASEFKSF